MSMCLQGIVDELVMKKEGRKITKVAAFCVPPKTFLIVSVDSLRTIFLISSYLYAHTIRIRGYFYNKMRYINLRFTYLLTYLLVKRLDKLYIMRPI